MKTIKLILYGVVLSLIVGCATTFKPWKLSEVQEGMSKAQVVNLLGEPNSTETKDGSERLLYSYEEYPALMSPESLNADGAMERQAEQIGRIIKANQYEVIIVDGKVLNYKEL